jgi:hypothetical protein
MSVIRWELPPEDGRGHAGKPSIYRETASALQKRPMKWAVVAEGMTTGAAGGLAYRIRHGMGIFKPAGAFEARCVGSVGGVAKVYARYTGGQS